MTHVHQSRSLLVQHQIHGDFAKKYAQGFQHQICGFHKRNVADQGLPQENVGSSPRKNGDFTSKKMSQDC